MKKPITKLREVMLEYIHSVFVENNYSRSETARDLGINIRSLFNYIKDIEQYNIGIIPKSKFDGFQEKKRLSEKTVFPTNKERLRYLDNPNFRSA